MRKRDAHGAQEYNRQYYMAARSRPKITAQELRQVLAYSPESGQFTYLADRGRMRAGDVAGTETPDGRRCIVVNGRRYFAHRLAWLYVTGSWPSQEIDHIDGDSLNNRFCNLRDVSSTINQQNKRAAPSTKKYSKLFGAHWCEQKQVWKSSIRVAGRSKHLGVFATEEEASAAYVEAKRRLHAGCTI